MHLFIGVVVVLLFFVAQQVQLYQLADVRWLLGGKFHIGRFQLLLLWHIRGAGPLRLLWLLLVQSSHLERGIVIEAGGGQTENKTVNSKVIKVLTSNMRYIRSVLQCIARVWDIWTHRQSWFGVLGFAFEATLRGWGRHGAIVQRRPAAFHR